MKLDIEQLNVLVVEEATKLKEAATKKEIDRLDFNRLNPENSLACIYGQMTGDCLSDRAGELIQSCASRVYKVDDDKDAYWDGNVYNKKVLNGAPTERRKHSFEYFSPIELFISYNGGKEGTKDNNAALIEFLKGNTKTLNLR